MNFNDIISSIVTLFCLLIVNNWFVIVEACVAFKGGNPLYIGYFIVFFFVGVNIAANILIAFAIDIYSVVERLDDRR